MKSKIFKFVRKVLSELSGAVVIIAVVIGIFIAIFANDGIMSLIAPVLVFVAGVFFYWLSWLISAKEDRK
ncbi:hypothetical protein [Brenneria corticis]|uniref:Uncharacterized protein n=1 Tax=Brenneria corticis TaxID=2173106 RepID=A0A2U1U187_9GAMM|nr:hypothetical protein [Brenneria sp. CFCC 11842]PWC15426.1 hypothetical protein DDT56_11870 [Brenneria sp. CFCC 11842]